MIYDCKKCGACCRAGWFDDTAFTAAYQAGVARKSDREVICERLGMTDEELCETYKINPPDGHMNFNVEPCRFLAPPNDAGHLLCTIHGFKPAACEEYPIWARVAKTGDSKLRYAARCPGMTLEPDDMDDVRAWITKVLDESQKRLGERPALALVDADTWTTTDAIAIRDWIDEIQNRLRDLADANRGLPVPLM